MWRFEPYSLCESTKNQVMTEQSLITQDAIYLYTILKRCSILNRFLVVSIAFMFFSPDDTNAQVNILRYVREFIHTRVTKSC